MRFAPIAATAMLSLSTSVIRADAPVLVSPDGLGRPTITATADGYALVHWDYGDAGNPGRPEGGLRFVALDASFRPIGGSVPLTIDDRFGLAELYRTLLYTHLEYVRDGYILFAQVNGYELDTLALDPDGRPRGESHELVFADALYPVTVAAGSNRFVVTYPEWYGTFQNWSQVVDHQGFAEGGRMPLAASRLGVEESYTWDSQVTRDGERFVAVWSQYPFGIRLREISPTGVPEGDPLLVHPDRCTQNVAVASNGRVQAIVYSEGCDQKDVFLILRDRKGARAPIPLAAEGYNEGIDPSGKAVHPLRVVSAGDRFGVLYRTSPRFAARCFFAEFDVSGRPIGAKRELNEEFGLDANDEVDLIFDEGRDRYVVAWGGAGPEGWGTYVLALPPAP